MVRFAIPLLALVALVGLTGLGCGDDDDTDAGADSGGDTDTDTDTDTDADTDPGPDVVTATITVPSDFDAAPEQLIASFHQTYPPSGDPEATAGSFMSPDIGPDTPYELEVDHAGLSGAYYLFLVLFVEGGGGGGSPMQGVDWIGGSPMALTLGPGEGTNDLGEIQLSLYL